MGIRKPLDVESYHFSSLDQIFIDANVWLFVYGPQPTKAQWEHIYSKTLSDIKTSKSRIYIDIMILSEYINRFVKAEYGHYKKIYGNRSVKEFRKSSDFENVSKEISINVKNILSFSSRCVLDFHSLNIEALLTQFESGDYDFNDQLIMELCRSYNLTLVTHDIDFKDADIPVLTANRNLLF